MGSEGRPPREVELALLPWSEGVVDRPRITWEADHEAVFDPVRLTPHAVELDVQVLEEGTLDPGASAATSPNSVTIGLDLGDRCSHFCVLDAGGFSLEPGRVAKWPAEPTAFLARVAPACLVVEVGGHSPRVRRLAQAAGMEVSVANTCRVNEPRATSARTIARTRSCSRCLRASTLDVDLARHPHAARRTAGGDIVVAERGEPCGAAVRDSRRTELRS
jgi:hypothetical protein